MACITRLLPFSGGNLLQPDESTVVIPINQCGQKDHLATFITIGSAVVHLARHWTCASSRLHTHCPFLFLSKGCGQNGTPHSPAPWRRAIRRRRDGSAVRRFGKRTVVTRRLKAR